MTEAALTLRLATLEPLLEVAKAMATKRQLDRLLELVVAEAANVAEADRCTLFAADRARELAAPFLGVFVEAACREGASGPGEAPDT